MSGDGDSIALDKLVLFRPAQIRRKASLLRHRSRQCDDLAEDCLTDGGKQALQSMAREFGREADELENALQTIRRLYAETFDMDSADWARE